jgi:hypothetical protein
MNNCYVNIIDVKNVNDIMATIIDNGFIDDRGDDRFDDEYI